VGDGQKSVAFRLCYQDPQATLSDDKVQELQNLVIAAVRQKYSIHVR
jgi:phenylalanyl-tRNA synthetase beta subunit